MKQTASVSLFYRRIRSFLWQSWIMYFFMIFIFLLFLYWLFTSSLERDIQSLTLFFEERLSLMEKVIRSGSAAEELYVSFFKINERGEITEAIPKWYKGENVSDSGLFQKLRQLKKDEIYLSFYPDFSDFFRRLYFVVRIDNRFLASTYDPESFFPEPASKTELYIADEKNICLYSTMPRFVGDVLHNGAFRFSSGKIFLSRRSNLRKTDNLQLIIEHDITKEVYFIGSVVLLSFILFFLIRFKTTALRKRLNALQEEFSSLSNRIRRFSLEDEKEVPVPGYTFYELAEMGKEFSEMAETITHREQELKDAEAKYRTIFENAVEGIFQSTPDGQYLNVSPSFARILGYDSTEEIIEKVNDIKKDIYVDPADREIFKNRLNDEGAVTGFETRFYTKDKRVVWVSISARTVKDQSGRTRYFEGFCMDISTQKKAEQEKSLLEEQLQQTQKMEAVGQLAGGIAHDFNNLLQALSGHVQLMILKKEETDEDYKFLVEMDKTANRATDLVKQLLTFSRKVEVRPRSLEINSIIKETKHLLERTIPKMVHIDLQLDPEVRPVLGDRTQMEQVFINLASNAADAMDGAGNLTIRTERIIVDATYRETYLELTSGEYVLIEISDTGHGMDEDTRKRIFEPFFTTKEMGKGTGLGLATVYGIVKGHKGHIHCYSEPDKGTTFRVYLPAGSAEMSAQEEQKNQISEKLRRGEETVLVVDDEAMVRRVAGEMLSRYGYRVLEAESGEEALKQYSADPDTIDLILMDLGMPGMGGEKCLAELRKMDLAVPVIVASGYREHKIAKNPSTYGASSFMAKPYRLNGLINEVRMVLDESSRLKASGG